MTGAPLIENGFATVGEGTWLVGRGQPAVALGSVSVRGLRGFLVPDRNALREVRTERKLWLSSAVRPFLTHLTCTGRLTAVSAKVLAMPAAARARGRTVRVIPMSFRRAVTVTELKSDWAVMATRSRVMRIVLAEGETATVRAEAAVGWTGRDPTGFCPRLRLRDLLLPRRAGSVPLALTFYGPQVVWAEGSDEL